MSNFIETFKKGKRGDNYGLTTGIVQLDIAINRLQRKTSIGVAAAPKVGKTTLCDYCFVISPYLECEKEGTLDNVEWIYWSFEIDRISKEFKYAAFFMYHDYGIPTYIYKGKKYQMDGDYLQGKKIHREGNTTELIPIHPDHEEKLKEIYAKRIVPLFGEWSDSGTLIKPGKITFIEERDNPTGMWKFLIAHAKMNGSFTLTPYETHDDNNNVVIKQRITGYVPKNPKKFTICITDHMRKLKKERGFSTKDNIDKWLEYQTEIRNLTSYTFINVVHSNRNLANVDKLKFAGEFIFPTGDDTKDSGNFAEECTILMTLFNPNDEKYNLSKHFGIVLENYPLYRSIHITESRYTECPVHIQTNMFGGFNYFEPIIKT